jgi:hypothetical protein
MVITLDIDDLVARLQTLGIDDMPKNTLKRWAFTEQVIPQPTTPNLKGRGFKSNWLGVTIEEAAAVWAVRHCGFMKPKTLTKKRIDVIKRVAAILEKRPFAIYTLPPITGPLSKQQIAFKDIKMKFVSEDFDGLDLFPGTDNADRVDCINELVIKWVAAVEKVRLWEVKGIEAYIEKHHPDLRDPTRAEVDFAQIDPWTVDVPCPWPIDKPACVKLHYKSLFKEFSRPPFQVRRSLSDSDRDNLIFLENFVDTRTFFKIDVSDSGEVLRARLKEIERSMQSSSISAGEKMTLSLYREWLQRVLLIMGTPA